MHPHTITPPPPCFTVGTTHDEIICSPTLRLTKTQQLAPKISNLDSSDQRTDFHCSNAHCLCFLAQESLFLLLVSFSSHFFAAIRWRRPDFTQSPLNSWCGDVSVTWTVTWKNWGCNLEVQLMNVSSTAEVTLGFPFLWWSSWEPNKIYFDLFNTFLVTTWFHTCYFIVLISSVSFYNVENSPNKEKPLNEQVCPNYWMVLYMYCIFPPASALKD